MDKGPDFVNEIIPVRKGQAAYRFTAFSGERYD